MDSAQLLVAVFGVLGSSGALVVIVNGVVKYFNGTAGRERARNISMREQRNEAWADAERERCRADLEAYNRRLTEEYASQLRRDCTEHGMTDKELRDWPVLKKPPPEQDPE
jgi:O-methyltransferase involved in polyketide biosynthesis